MAATSFNLNPHRAGTIRRVVRCGSRYMCGLCRSRYDDEVEALTCVQDCWLDFLDMDPVILRRRALRTVYRCRYCARDHDKRPKAFACATDCRMQMKKLFDREILSLDIELPVNKRRLSRRPKLVPLPMAVRPNGKKTQAEIEAELPPPVTTEATVRADVSAAAAAPAPDAASASGGADPAAGGEAGEKKPRVKKPPEEGYYRDNAKYACIECNARYFTKEEVMKCYMSH